MRKDTAMKIFKSMVLTIVVLVMGLAVVLSMLAAKTSELESVNQVLESTKENADKRMRYLKDLYNNAYDSFDLHYVGEYKLTAYCTEKYEHICGEGHGLTSSGQPVQAGISAAVADTDKFPYGTILYIEGVGIRVVQDTGGGLEDDQIDLAMGTHEDALHWGVQEGRKVYILEVGEQW